MKQETERFAHTKTAEMILNLDAVYKEIDEAESEWKKACPVRCIDGCGACCIHFEPEIYEIEALYLAAWLLYHQRKRALRILNGDFAANTPDKQNGCLLFDIDNPHHCTVYGGRCLICRLFGYSGDRGKDRSVRWRPCRFTVSKNEAAGVQKQYGQADLLRAFGSLPPVMSDFTARILCFMSDGNFTARPIRKSLPAAVSKILMLQKYSDFPQFDPGSGPASPPLAS